MRYNHDVCRLQRRDFLKNDKILPTFRRNRLPVVVSKGWGQQVPLKCCQISTKQHNVTLCLV